MLMNVPGPFTARQCQAETEPPAGSRTEDNKLGAARWATTIPYAESGGRLA